MPADRLFHPRLGRSKKVGALSELEVVVWAFGFVLGADDYGVMPCSALLVQSMNNVLAKRPLKVIAKCLERLVEVELVTVFTHQGDRYLCQLDWQDFQKVRYPRESSNPSPPPDVLVKCSASTRDLFRQRFGNILKADLSLQRAGAREEANGKRLTANGKRLTAPDAASAETTSVAPVEPVADGAIDEAVRFCERFVELYAQYRNGARYRMRPALDHVRVLPLLEHYGRDRLEKLAVLILTTDDDWVEKTDRGLGILISRANWAEERLTAWEVEHGSHT